MATTSATGGGDRLHDLVGVLGGIGDVRGGGNFLREDAALKVLAAGADAARLNEEGNRIEQAEVGAAMGLLTVVP